MIQTYGPARKPDRRQIWLPLALTVMAVVIGAIIAMAFPTTSIEGEASINPLFTPTNPLSEAVETCAAGTLSDADHTLIVDMAGEDYGSGAVAIDDVLCVLNELDTPQAVIAQMASTRALDGMQSATWDTYQVKWTYHPTDGLDLIITQAD
jgi:hypothetical protein